MGLGGGGELARLGQPADVADVGLDDVDDPELEQLAELDTVVDALAQRLAGGTGSSIQRGAYGSSDTASWAAVSGENRPCISIMRSMSGPIASRTAATTAVARRRSAAVIRTSPHDVSTSSASVGGSS